MSYLLNRYISLSRFKHWFFSVFALAFAVFFAGDSVDAQSTNGLLYRKCEMERFYKDSVYFDFVQGQYVTVQVAYDSLVCRIFVDDSYDGITFCDTVQLSVSKSIDSTYLETRSILKNGDWISFDVYEFDTVEFYRYVVTCFEVDTTYKYDTTSKHYSIVNIDTLIVSDSFILSDPSTFDRVSMFFCPHVHSDYYPFDGFSSRFMDSIRYYETKLEELLSTWPDGVRVVSSLEEQVKKIVDNILVHYPDSIVDTSYIIDSIESIIPITPEYYRSKIEMFLAAQQRYADSVVHTQEYHIDSVNVVADLHMKGGAVMTDTFTIRTIPLFYELMPDTSVQFEKSLPIWAGSPRLPWNDADTYVELTWFPPVDAVTRKVVKPRQGFDADGLVEYGDVSLTDSVHIKALIRQGGVNNFLAWAPIYTADTADGDSLLFPIRIKATKALMGHYPNAPEESCEYVDTVKVRIVKGYNVSGYVSYAGLWLPSTVGDTRSPDVQTFDGDLSPNMVGKHLPVANVTIYLESAESHQIMDSCTSGKDGYFSFSVPYVSGRYVVTGRSPQKKVVPLAYGVNGNDAAWVQNYATMTLPTETLPENTNSKLSMWWWAANVDLSEVPPMTKGVSPNDAVAIQSRFTQTLNNGNRFSTEGANSVILDDWAYSIDTIDLISDTMVHVRGIMRGDADRNYYDDKEGNQFLRNVFVRKKQPLKKSGVLRTPKFSTTLKFPVISVDSGRLSGIQLFLYFNSSKVEPLGVSLPLGLQGDKTSLVYNVVDDQILTTWVNSSHPMIHSGDTLMYLHLKIKGDLSRNIGNSFAKNALQYIVSDSMARIISWEIAMPTLELYRDDTLNSAWKPIVKDGDTVYVVPDKETPLMVKEVPTGDKSHILSVIPNPISTWGDVVYYVSGDCLVNLKLYSLLGENVLTFVDGERQRGMYRLNMDMQSLPSGIYVLRLETAKDGETEFDIEKIIIKR